MLPEIAPPVGPLAACVGSQVGAVAAALTNQVAEHGMMRTSPMKRSTDASQRGSACATRLGGAAAGGDASQRSPVCANPLGEAAALGDASRRKMVGKVSLGVAVIGGDASQRSPPGCPSGMRLPASTPVQRNCIAFCDEVIPLKPRDASRPNPSSGKSQGITGTSPTASSSDSSRCSSVHDASQRSPAGSTLPNFAVDGRSDALKSWLAGARSNSSPESGIDLAERLRAAAPQSYED